MNIHYRLTDVVPKEHMLDGNFLEKKHISVKEMNAPNGNEYKIYKYDKMSLTFDSASSLGLFRSVIFNKDKIVAFAPPKSHNYSRFVNENKDFNDVIVQEFIEGTMINLFYEKNTSNPEGEWELATKTTVGGNSAFFKDEEKITFRRMFLDAMNESGLEFEHLDKKYTYSFVVQHPKNRIVSLVTRPKLYLVAVYEIDNDNYVITENTATDMEVYSHVSVPEQFYCKDYDEVQSKFASMSSSYDIVGAIIKNKEGHRTKIRNPVYEKVKHLRGNNPKLQFQYFALRKTGKVREFLKYYPEYKKEFTKFRDDIHAYTEALHMYYMACYVRKEKPLIQFPKEYRGNMFKLHEQYVENLREKNEKVSRKFVIEYVNNLHPAQLMYVINQPLRKQLVDNEKQILQDKKDESEAKNES